MNIRAFAISLTIAFGLGSATLVYAAWTGAPSNPPSNNALGPVWLQSGAPIEQTGNFRISGKGTSDEFIGTNTGNSVQSYGNISFISSGKAIQANGSGGTLINMGNWGSGATGFTLGLYGDVNVLGKSGGYLDGSVNVNQICLVNDPTTPCRTTWPTGTTVSDIWVDTAGDTMTGDLSVPNNMVSAKTLWAGGNFQVQRMASTQVFRTGSWDGTYDNFMEFISDPSEAQTVKFFTDAAVGPNVGLNGVQIRVNNSTDAWRAAFMDGTRSGFSDRSLTLIEQIGALSFNANTPGSNQQRVGGYLGYCPGGVTPCAGLKVSVQNVGGNSQGADLYNNAGNRVILADQSYAVYGISSAPGFTTGYFQNDGNAGKAITAVASQQNGVGIEAGANALGGVGGKFTGETWGLSSFGKIGGVFNGTESGISVVGGLNGGQFWGQNALSAYGTAAFGYGVYGQNTNGFGVQGNGLYGGYFLGSNAGLASGHSINTNNWVQLGTNSFGAVVSGNMQVYGSGGGNAYIGDQGCGAGYAGFQVNGGSMAFDCQHYNLLGGQAGQTFINAYGGNPIYFRQQNGTLALLNSSGDMGIGIGNGTPYGRLELKGPRDPLLTLNADAGYHPAIHYRMNGVSRWYTWANQGTLEFNIGSDAVNPLLKLGRFGDVTLTAGQAYKPGGGSWSVWSDARLKDIHGSYPYGLDDISRLEPVYYNYKDGNEMSIPSGDTYVGVVAQDVQKAIPDAVSVGKDGYLTVDNDPIIWAMVNSIKELKAENDQLKARLDALETK